MATHRWISTTGNFNAPASWDSASAPVTGVGTLTFTGQPLDTETVTIDTKVYTFQTALTNVDGNVLIGVSAEASRDNIMNAMNLGGTPGTDYATLMTEHASCTGSSSGTDKLVATGDSGSVADDARVTTETLTNASWADTTLTPTANWATGDTVIFAEDSQVSAGTNMDANLVDVALFFIGEQFTGSVGVAGSPLIISADRLVHQGKGTLHFDNSSAVIGAAPITTDEMIIAHTGDPGDLAASIRSDQLTTLAVARGQVEVAQITSGTTRLILSYVDNQQADADVTLFDTPPADLPAEARLFGGTLRVLGDVSINELWISGAAVYNESVTAFQSAIHIYSGSVEWNTSATIARAELYGGILDLTGSSEAKTVTLLFQHPNATFNYLPDLTTFTRVDMDGKLITEG